MIGIDHRARVAAFDVDGTITRHDCVVPFLRRVAGTATLGWRLSATAPSVVTMLARRDRNGLKAAAAAAAFAGQPLARIDALAEDFARSVHATGLRQDTVDLLDAHRRRGDTVLLVSASFEVYLRPLAELLGADDVLAARLEVRPDGTLTGRLSGANCRGPEKVRRLHEWLDEHAGGRAEVHLTAYGDSAGDRELLADADEARWVGRGAMPR
ncbi:MAG TPA: HAD-IB family hydrolase [Ilumatobacteraceae bacterium]|nr:HAD-IB family hydrolase [Ilumatobacteraceae bacterium]